MNNWYSHRFKRQVWLTNHAIESMAKRGVVLDSVLDLIETGEIKPQEGAHAWIFKGYPERTDNLICAAVIVEQAVIVKTIMVNWTLREKAP
ncbi:DUF4258 domain-containing protein [Nitrosococcus wardiae]|uniref:DUF4258 domain-containing protein n=1 Tax=Nitrosococcus wardiae TaxID=1814290 RepID=A0A4P7C3H6_9GAMM|nr:DUF4258 domain-containing protein [Nitrosococcus wardiae]QBQ56227.1 DUF4258 domain-containing protein [Nitrosococcus wardiae]